MNKTNMDIRKAIKEAGLHMWQVADAFGIRDSEFSRKFRKEMNDSEKAQIKEVIAEVVRTRKLSGNVVE